MRHGHVAAVDDDGTESAGPAVSLRAAAGDVVDVGHPDGGGGGGHVAPRELLRTHRRQPLRGELERLVVICTVIFHKCKCIILAYLAWDVAEGGGEVGPGGGAGEVAEAEAGVAVAAVAVGHRRRADEPPTASAATAASPLPRRPAVQW